MIRGESNSLVRIVRTDKTYRQSLVVIMCLTAYAMLAVIAFWPVSPWNDSRLPSSLLGGIGSGDPVQMTWFLDWVPYALEHGLSIFHTNFLDYPHGVDLANGSSSPLHGIIAAPVTLTLGPVSAYNLLLRFAFASSAASMFLVLRMWCRWPVAFIGGLIYGFGPYMVSQGHFHLNLVFVPIPPLIVWCLHEVLVTQTRGYLRMGLYLGGLAGAQALIEPELLALLAVVIFIGLVGTALVERSNFRQRFGQLLRVTVPAMIVFLSLTGYMLWSMLFAPGHLVGPAQPVSTLQLYRADLLGAIVPTGNQFIVPKSLATMASGYVGGNLSENSSYLSLPFVLLVTFLAVKFRKERLVSVSAILALVAFVLSLGPILNIGGHVTVIPMPEALFSHLTLLDNTVPVRFSFVTMTFMVIASAAGANHLLRESSSSAMQGRGGIVVSALGVSLMIASIALLLPRVPFATKSQPWPKDTASTLNVIPPGTVVLTYPFTVGLFTEAMSWQAADFMRFRIIGGYATTQGPGNFGDGRPPLLDPPFVEEYLVFAQYGAQYAYPRPNSKVDPKTALCKFVLRYNVGAVVFMESGARPARVNRLFEQVLGVPTQFDSGKKVKVWLTQSDRCPK